MKDICNYKAAFYMVGPALMEAMVEALGDRELHSLVRARMSDGATPIKVDIDDLKALAKTAKTALTGKASQAPGVRPFRRNR